MAIACKHGGAHVTDGVERASTPTEALRLLEHLLQQYRIGDQLFITARTHDSMLSMWRTGSKAAGMYWCASALAKLWRQAVHGSDDASEEEPPLLRAGSAYVPS